MYAGDRVTVYEDPVTREKPEEVVTLLRLIRPDCYFVGDEIMQRWRVRFDDGMELDRMIAVVLVGKQYQPADGKLQPA